VLAISPTTTHFSVELSVVCNIRKPCLNRSMNLRAIWLYIMLDSGTVLEGKRRFEVKASSQNLLLPTNDSPGDSADEQFRLLGNHFCSYKSYHDKSLKLVLLLVYKQNVRMLAFAWLLQCWLR